MTPAATSGALRALPQACHDALCSGDQVLVEGVAHLRDELHAVANRVARLLAAPGSTLAPMDIGLPSALAGPSSTDLLVALLTMAAQRLAGLADGLDEQQWRVVGHLGPDTITVGQLIARPLHSAHRMLSDASRPLGLDVPNAQVSAPHPSLRP